eukprot:TRINITY_DN4300_c0_g1_i1.p1 TRINITY_DN4300_c0_g1~~TRINITY_DN4300_c0_g1_i1.p1  ORF type:complete len:810 (+),score=175.26 TRINITY_DN4300_c0_g1_i1:25-2430(+)
MLGLEGYDSESSGEQPMIGKKPKKNKEKGRQKAWLGDFGEDDDEYTKHWNTGTATTKQKKTDAPMEFVKAPPLQPTTLEENDKGLPPKTQAKFTISLASPKKELPPLKPAVSARSQQESLGFMGDLSKGKNNVILNMMKKMGGGWKPGEGMGKNKQGISEAISVKVRPKGRGVGSIDEKTDQQKRKERRENGEPEEAKPEPASREAPRRPMQHVTLAPASKKSWKKKKEKKLKEKDLTFGETTLDDVLDLTAGEYPVYDDTKGVYLKDLRTKLGRNLKDTEETARILDKRISDETEKLSSLEEQHTTGTETKEKQMQSITEVEEVLKVVQKLHEKILEPGQRSIASSALCKAVLRLQGEYPVVSTMLKTELQNLVLTLAVPLVQKELLRWDIGTDPGKPTQTIALWREFLRGGSAKDPFIYKQFVWEILGDPLKLFFNIRWKPSEPQRGIAVLDTLSPFLPKSCTDHLLDTCVAPRLFSFIDQSTDITNLHEAVTPWGAVFSSERMTSAGIIGGVQTKLTSLSKPSISVEQARIAVTPWKDIFTEKQYTETSTKYGLRKISTALENIVFMEQQGVPKGVVPSVMSWVQFEGPDSKFGKAVLTALETDFFPRMVFATGVFLKKTADFQTACSWYRFWKEETAAVGDMQGRYMGVLLSLITAAKAYWNTRPEEAPVGGFNAITTNAEAVQILAQKEKDSEQTILSSYTATDHHSLKENVEYLASEADLPFHPHKAYSYDGKQVYLLGGLQVCIDMQCLYICTGPGKWVPAPSITEVVDKALAMRAKKAKKTTEEEHDDPIDLD